MRKMGNESYNVNFERKHLKPFRGLWDYVIKTAEFNIMNNTTSEKGDIIGLALTTYNVLLVTVPSAVIVKGLEALLK